jgi:uncharacterized protein YjbI with pentapeptide repeats
MSPEVTAAIIAASVSVLTLIGTLAAQYFGRRVTSRDTQQALEEQRKQLDRTLAEQRTRTMNERFATAAEQLGSDKPAVRLAGVYAMAGLADDWKENRQTCVDVLCAYLRMPYEPDPGQDAPEPQRLAFQAIREVRHTVIRVITAHLREDAAVSWQGLNFDFTGVVFDGGDFSSAQFPGGEVSFSDAEFSGGEVSFSDVQFSGAKVDFNRAQFSGGTVDFIVAQFSGGTVHFSRARFSGGEVDFGFAEFSGSGVDFSRAEFSDGTVNFNEAEFSASRVDFSGAQLSGAQVGFGGVEFSGGKVDFSRARFSGSEVGFSRAEFSGGTVDFSHVQLSGGRVGFSHARFSGGEVGFSRARFSGGEVGFSRAEFSGGTVDFSDAGDWSFPPAFPWTDTPPSGVKLPRKEDLSEA